MTLKSVYEPVDWSAPMPVPNLNNAEPPERRFWPGAAFSIDPQTSLDAYPKGLVALGTVFGFLLVAFFIYQGVTDVIPNLGLFGIVWTGVAVLALLNGLRMVWRSLRR